jgi:hypothetical protein
MQETPYNYATNYKVGDKVVVKENPYRATAAAGGVSRVGTIAYVTDVIEGFGCQLALDPDCDPDEHSDRSLYFLEGQFEPYNGNENA